MSKAKHTVAVLRLTLGMTQKHFADEMGISIEAVQSIESNNPKRLRLTEKMAERLMLQTNVDPRWLLKNDVSAPIVDTSGNPYTKATYDEFKAEQKKPQTGFFDIVAISIDISRNIERVLGLYLKAYKDDKIWLLSHKLGGALSELEAEFQQLDRPAEDSIVEPITEEYAVKLVSRFLDQMMAAQLKKIKANPNLLQQYKEELGYLRKIYGDGKAIEIRKGEILLVDALPSSKRRPRKRTPKK